MEQGELKDIYSLQDLVDYFLSIRVEADRSAEYWEEVGEPTTADLERRAAQGCLRATDLIRAAMAKEQPPPPRGMCPKGHLLFPGSSHVCPTCDMGF